MSASIARRKADGFSQHSTRIRRGKASDHRRRQMPTACRSQPMRSAISSLEAPSKASRIMRARWARAWEQVLERVMVRRVSC